LNAPARLALDRASVRSFDADGRLHVAVANVSRACVNEYLGGEVPGGPELGLSPNRVYRLLRDPDELAAAVSSFNGVPVLREHCAVDAVAYRPDLVVGSTGNDAVFDGTNLTNSLVIWSADAIRGIEDGSRGSLSAGYRYVPVMRPGRFEGEPYQGIMTRIVGNHISLVAEGRIGRSAVIGDSAPSRLRSRETARARLLRRVPELARIKIGTW
jgi:hypothetical protein